MRIFTIGYQHSHPDEIFNKLKDHYVSLLLDVRSFVNGGRPVFRKNSVEHFAPNYGFQYVWAKELGGKPYDRSLYTNGKPDYRKMALSPVFTKGVGYLCQDLNHGQTIALMCMEANPDECHRKNLITDFLKSKMKINVIHL